MSFSVKVGRSTTTPGRFIFFLSPILALFCDKCVVSAVSNGEEWSEEGSEDGSEMRQGM